MQRVRRKQACLLHQVTHGAQPQAHQHKAARRDQRSPAQGSGQQGECKPTQQLAVIARVQCQDRGQLVRCGGRRGHFEAGHARATGGRRAHGALVEDAAIGPRQRQGQILVPDEEVVELVGQRAGVAAQRLFGEQVPHLRLLLRQRLDLPRLEAHVRDGVDRDADHGESGQALKRQPCRQTPPEGADAAPAHSGALRPAAGPAKREHEHLGRPGVLIPRAPPARNPCRAPYAATCARRARRACRATCVPPRR